MKHRFEIHKNAEKNKLAYLSPIKPDGKTASGFRIAGPKAWGGSSLLAEIDIDDNDIISYIRDYAPHITGMLLVADK